MSTITGPTVFKDRFKISPQKVLGSGGFATVYRGLDTVDCKGVAVKVYHETDAIAFESFSKSIEVLTKLHRPTSPAKRPIQQSPRSQGSGDLDFAPTDSFKPELLTSSIGELGGADGDREMLPERVLRDLSFQDCFVKLIDYSTDSFGKPGLDIGSEVYFLVFELGEMSLDEVLQSCNDKGKTLSVNELRSLHWSLVCIVCGLHHEGFVHMDIKPVNVMRFRPEGGRTLWKLIDLDGAMRTGTAVPVKDLVFTPQYMCPELAASFKELENRSPVKTPKGETAVRIIKLSRLMDIWSVGMCALEAIFLTPILDPWYTEWREETGSDTKFFQWLGDFASDAIISGEMEEALSEIHPDLCKFLIGMLSRDPKERMCITECLNHKWLQPVRKEISDQIDEYVNTCMESRALGKRVSILEDYPLDLAEDKCMSSMAVNADVWESTGSTIKGQMTERTARAKLIKQGLASKTCAMM